MRILGQNLVIYEQYFSQISKDFGSGTHLIVLVLVFVVLLVGATLFKTPKAPSFQIRSG